MKIKIIHLVYSIGSGDAYGIKGASVDKLSRRRGHDDGERDVFSSILSIVLLLSRAVTPSRGLPSTQM